MKKNQPLVSIIIVTWNRKNDILDALDDIKRQTYPHLEVIIVDNGSTDGTIQEVKRFDKLRVLKSKSANKAIGINEIRENLNKKIQINEAIEKISIKTRQYAKRQSTWGRGNMLDWNKITPNNINKFLKKI